jgi:hypothetical protein
MARPTTRAGRARACLLLLCVTAASAARSIGGEAQALLRGVQQLLHGPAPAPRVTLAAHALPLPAGWLLKGA